MDEYVLLLCNREPAPQPAEAPAGEMKPGWLAKQLARAHEDICPTCQGTGLREAAARIAAPTDEILRWRKAMAYFVGDMADTATPEECRAEGMRQALTPHGAALRDCESMLDQIRRCRNAAELWEHVGTSPELEPLHRRIWAALAALPPEGRERQHDPRCSKIGKPCQCQLGYIPPSGTPEQEQP